MISKSIKKRLLGLLTSAALALGLAASLPVTSPAIMTATAEAAAPTAKEIVADMGLGWNLGNSFESSYYDNNLQTYVYGETAWGNPRTTKNMILAVKAKGFNTIRVPVTWRYAMANEAGGDYTVSADWFARVKEVVDYAIDEDMYVILNSHHDNWNRPLPSNYSAASTELKALWGQIATYFADYDYHLIFEGMNEPRNYDAGNEEWIGGTDEQRNVVNQLNKDFVDTVRATGGNNSTRALMVPTYAASISDNAMTALSNYMSTFNDSNLIVSLHAYIHNNFAFSKTEGAVFDDSYKSDMNYVFNQMDSLFLSKGYSICIGEFSATNMNNTSERVKWAEYYANKVKALSTKYSNTSVSAVLWDNNAISTTEYEKRSELHGYLNRAKLEWYSVSEPVVDKLCSILGNEEVPFVPVYDRDGYVILEGNSDYWSQTSISKSTLLAGNDEDNVISVTLKSDFKFTVFDSSWNSTSDLSEYTVPVSEIENKVIAIGVSCGEGETRTVEWKVNKVVNGVYKQFTELDANGKYTQRGVIELAESEVDKIDYVNITFTYPAIGYTKIIKCTKYYTGIKAGDTTYRPADGYVYIIATLKNIPNSSVPITDGLDVSYELVYKT
ncbi:MAG: glycoside hydrolase family 5 protein [Ruminococcus sp.]|nr:glycoside hydrolase family 5 protein [Ruminococcus sp.]MBR4622849.1 glycoside hydrolase family 5 protein [Ruminococcus sp.]